MRGALPVSARQRYVRGVDSVALQRGVALQGHGRGRDRELLGLDVVQLVRCTVSGHATQTAATAGGMGDNAPLKPLG